MLQGSTLGPLLFLLYINDLHNCLGKSNARIFADDTTLFYSSKDPMDVQNTIYDEFQSLLNCCTANKLSVNFKKTNYKEIAPAHKTKLINLPCIEKKSHIKYLGVYLDDKFSWSFQIQHIINKLSKSLSVVSTTTMIYLHSIIKITVITWR